MTAVTVPVTVKLADFGGPALAGIKVTARLSDVEFAADGTAISTDPVTVLTDASGTAVLNVFPNAVAPYGLGTRGTTVTFTASMPNSRALNVQAQIPNSPCNLTDAVVEDDSTPLSASQAAALGAQSSAAVASTQAGIATAKAAAAATSEANAATSASNAATSEANAASSASSAANSYDSFDDRYLGTKTSDPLVDNDGDPLQTGALYFNTTAGNMRVWTGAAWSVVSIATSAYMAGLLTAATAAAARTSLGATTVGSNVFTAATAAAARSALGSTATGDALVTATTAAAARGTLGSGATGDALFLTATAAAARAAIATASTAELQGQIFVAFTTAGTATAYTLTPTPALAAYAAGVSFFVRFHVACGAAPTLNISGLGATVNLVKQLADGTFGNVAAGDIPVDHRSRVTFLSTTQALVESFPGAGRLLNVQTITATQVYTPTPGTNKVRVRVQGGGGAGGGTPATAAGQQAAGSGGGAGGWAESLLTAGFAGVTVTIGAPGLGVVSNSGGNGGTTTFGAGILAGTGGTGGFAISALGNTISAISSGAGGGGGSGGNISNSIGGLGGTAFFTPSGVLSGAGGASYFGQGGSPVTGSVGVSAIARGAGGGGAAQGASGVARAGGDGQGGCCIIEEYS